MMRNSEGEQLFPVAFDNPDEIFNFTLKVNASTAPEAEDDCEFVGNVDNFKFSLESEFVRFKFFDILSSPSIYMLSHAFRARPCTFIQELEARKKWKSMIPSIPITLLNPVLDLLTSGNEHLILQ